MLGHLLICFENVFFVKQVTYLLRKYDFRSDYDFSFGNTSVSEKVNYLFRAYDLFVQKYDLFEEY